MATTTVVRAPSDMDELLPIHVTNIIRYCLDHGVELDFYDAVQVVVGAPPTLIDVAQYAIDALNEDLPIGVWFSLDDDYSLVKEEEAEEA